MCITTYSISAMAPAPALAGSADGKLQVKLLGTGVLPDGKIVDVKNDPLGLTVGANTKANDNVVPTLAIEYFFTPNISAETICCLTQHHVSGTGALAAATEIVDHVLVLPATLMLKYHVPMAGGIKPYVGAGPAMFLYIDEKPGSSIVPLGVTRVKFSNDAGFALQAGVDIKVVSEQLGHSTTTLTRDTYQSVAKSLHHEAAGAVAARIRAKRRIGA